MVKKESLSVTGSFEGKKEKKQAGEKKRRITSTVLSKMGN